ncbi:MAG: 23S rRNA (uracil(1939)-C(5))-methyltransferase RlmD [Eubacteriales bacterium]|nr:23S rRNA (uracil(1939)-C(5))-methyltransferase RlmD [Eubacteriales bacterium]
MQDKKDNKSKQNVNIKNKNTGNINGKNNGAKNAGKQNVNGKNNSLKSAGKQNVNGKNSSSKNTSKQNINAKNGNSKKVGNHKSSICPYSNKCGGCEYIDMPYKEQLKLKEKQVRKLLNKHCEVKPIIGMDNPFNYRNKVHAVLGRSRQGEILSGIYERNSHRIINVENCMIENRNADEIIQSIKGLLKSFKIKVYDEDTGYGLLRHILVRTGHKTGEVMVILVLVSPILPSKNNFVKALRKLHPEISTVVINVNDKKTSMVLGKRDIVLYGKGYIEDVLCGNRYRISPQSFYQINPVQTEVLYNKAIKLAGLTGNEMVIDAYCGIGTIGITASSKAKEVIGVELNPDAVKDAYNNAKINGIKNIKFTCDDAGKFMVKMAENGMTADIVFMDPPRSGSTEEFIDAVVKLSPDRVVYISCNPVTLERDLCYFEKCGYRAVVDYPVDMFAMTGHVETVCLMSKKCQF